MMDMDTYLTSHNMIYTLVSGPELMFNIRQFYEPKSTNDIIIIIQT